MSMFKAIRILEASIDGQFKAAQAEQVDQVRALDISVKALEDLEDAGWQITPPAKAVKRSAKGDADV